MIIGRIQVEVEVTRFLQTEKVELYVDNQLKNVFTESPYTWVWSEPTFGRHTLTVKVYYGNGVNSTTSLQVTAFIL